MKKIYILIALVLISSGVIFYCTKNSRILITHDDYDGENSIQTADMVLVDKINADLPTEWVVYRGKGIEFHVPYNPKWGTEKYKIKPYEYIKNEVFEGIIFGPVNSGEGGGIGRNLSLSIVAPRIAESIVAAAREEDPRSKVEVKTINQLKVVESTGGYFCTYSAIQIAGNKYNYVVSNNCDTSPTVAEPMVMNMKYLEELVAKAKLI